MKEIKEDLNKWKAISHSRIGRLNIVKVTVLPKLIYRFSATPTKITTAFFAKMDKLILQFIWKFKGPRRAKQTLKSTKLENPHFPVQNLLQSYRNQDRVYWRKVGPTD